MSVETTENYTDREELPVLLHTKRSWSIWLINSKIPQKKVNGVLTNKTIMDICNQAVFHVIFFLFLGSFYKQLDWSVKHESLLYSEVLSLKLK